jgi:hypothetical protein
MASSTFSTGCHALHLTQGETWVTVEVFLFHSNGYGIHYTVPIAVCMCHMAHVRCYCASRIENCQRKTVGKFQDSHQLTIQLGNISLPIFSTRHSVALKTMHEFDIETSANMESLTQWDTRERFLYKESSHFWHFKWIHTLLFENVKTFHNSLFSRLRICLEPCKVFISQD